MENILINFTESGLDEITQKVIELKQSMAGLATGGTVSAGSSTAAGSSSPGKTSSTSVEKKATDDLTIANKKLLASYDDLSKKYNSLKTDSKATIDAQKKSIDELSKAQKNVNAEIGNKAATGTLIAQIRKVREEIAAMDLAGQRGTETYNKLVQTAGRLDDAMMNARHATVAAGSDTQAFDALTGSLQLATGGFTALQGASAMFGGESEDLQKTMLNLQSAIALSVGLQQGLNAVQRDSAVIVGIVTLQTKAKALADSLATKGTIGATIAQRIFNAVAAANPYVLLAMALISVVGALYLFSKGADVAAEKQQRANELDAQRIESLNRISERYKVAGQEREKALSNELELLKSSGISVKQQAEAERKLIDEKLKNAAQNAGFRAKEIEGLEENRKKVIDLQNALAEFENAKRMGQKNMTFMVNGQVQKIEVSDKGKDSLEKQIENITANITIGADAKAALRQAKLDVDKFNAQQKIDALKNARSEAIAAAEVRLIEARKGSAEELAAKIQSIEAQRRADLDNVNLTASERKLKMVKADKDIADANRAFAVLGLEDERSNLNAKLSLTKEGSKEEFELKKQLLDQGMKIELADINLSNAKRLEIEANYNKQKAKLIKDYNDKLSQETVSNDINFLNAELSLTQQGSDDEYRIKVQLIEKQRLLEEKQINASLDSEELKLSKITALNAKAQADINELSLAKQVEGINKFSKEQTLLLSEQYRDGKISKSQFEDEKIQITIQALNAEIAARRKAGKETIDLEQQLADQQIALAEKVKEAKTAVAQEAFNTLLALGNSIYDGEKSRLNQQLSDLDHYYTTDVDAAKKNKNLKLISEQDYNNRKLKINQQIAINDKKQATFNAIMTGAQAVLRAFADYIFPYNLIIAALVAAQTAIQINTIKNQPIPKYWKGRKSGKGEMAWVGEQGPEVMWVPKGAAILPAHKSNKVADAIGIMREYNIPVLPSVHAKAIEEAKTGSYHINYDLLARKIGEQMKQNIIFPKASGQRPVSINVDHSGTTVIDGNTTTRYRNRKYVGNV